MLIYPDNLMPINGYKKINEESIHNCSLIRRTNIKDCFDPSTEQLKNEVLELEDKRFFDWSCSLYSKFSEVDFKYQITNQYFNNIWDFENTIEKPKHSDDFEISEEYSVYFLNISDVKGIEIPFEKQEGKNKINYKSKTMVCHVPTNCNYWHFEILWVDDAGNIIKRKSTSWNNALTSTIKSVIRQYCLKKEEIEPLVEIEETEYINPTKE